MEYKQILNKNVIPRSVHIALSNGDKGHDGNWIRTGILQLFGTSMYKAMAELFYGDPYLATDYYFNLTMKYNKSLGKLVSTPKLVMSLFPKQTAAREELLKKMKDYVRDEDSSLYQEHASANLSELVKEIRSKLTYMAGSLMKKEHGRTLILPLWSSTLNSVPTIFWVVYHLLADKLSYATIQKEVMSILEEKYDTERRFEDDINWSFSDLQQMVNLDSLITESLRLETTAKMFVTRTATEDFVMRLSVEEGKQVIPIKKNTLFVTCPTILHRDKEVFEDALTFKWNRFVPIDGKPPKFKKNGVEVHDPVRAFGCGPTICPGRKFAMSQIKIMVALFIVDYEFRFVGDIIPSPPKINNEKTGIFCNGIPVNDIDIEFRRKRDRS